MKKDITTLAPVIETPTPTPPDGAPDLAWIAPLVEAATAAQTACAEHDARQAVLRAENEAAPYLAKAEAPVAIARAALPALENYQAASAPIRAAAAAMGLDVGSNSLVAKADAGGVIKNIREAMAAYAAMQRGQATHLDTDLAEILVRVKGAERQLDGYRVHLATLVQTMQDVALARATHPLPAGPTVEFPARPRSEPVGPPVLDFDVFNYRKE